MQVAQTGEDLGRKGVTNGSDEGFFLINSENSEVFDLETFAAACLELAFI